MTKRPERNVMNRRTLIRTAGAASVGGGALALPACAAGDSGGAGPTGGAPQARQATTLEYWSRFNQAAADEVESKRLAEFEQKLAPVKVVKTITGGEYQEKLDAAFAAGSPPDTASLGGVSTYAGRNVTLVLDKNGAVQNDAADYQSFLFNRCKYEGKLHGLPYIADVRAMMYRQDAMRDAGLNSTSLPDTWEQFRDLSKKLTKWDGETLTRSGWNVPKSGNTAYDIFLVMHDGIDKPAFDSWETPTTAQFNGPAGRQALQLLVDLVNKDRVDSFQQPAAVAGSRFLGGQYAALWSSAGEITTAQRSAPGQLQHLSVAFTPKFAKRTTFAGGSYLIAKKDTKDPRSAADFLLSLTQGNNAVDISRATSAVPARKSSATSEYVKDPLIKPFFDSIEHGRINIVHAYTGQIRDIIAKEIEAAIKQQKASRPPWTTPSVAPRSC